MSSMLIQKGKKKRAVRKIGAARCEEVGVPMSDLIERNAAINALEEHRALFCDNTPESFSRLALEDKARVDEIDNAIATLVNLPSAEQMGWTPTSVRPPKEFEYVLVQLSCGYELKQYIPPRIKPKYKDGYWGESDGVDYDYFDVVAWRTLPEQYKEGGK